MNKNGILEICQECKEKLNGSIYVDDGVVHSVLHITIANSTIPALRSHIAALYEICDTLIEDYVLRYERDENGKSQVRCSACGSNDSETDSLIHEDICPVTKLAQLKDQLENKTD